MGTNITALSEAQDTAGAYTAKKTSDAGDIN